MATNKKQTAVEYLEDKLFNRPIRPLFVSISVTELSQLLNQAKQMEREQMINFYGQGVADTSGEITDATKGANQYYELRDNDSIGKLTSIDLIRYESIFKSK